jgi:signal transduction histidine kinase
MRRSVEAVEQQSMRMAEMIGELLDASRIRLGRFDLVRAPTQFRTVLESVIARLAPDVASRLQLQLDPAGERGGEWDAGRLEHVLENILSNAVKFSPADSPIEIVTQATPECLIVSVCDHGRGVDAAELAQLFDRFYRSPSAASEGIEGSGLGLYIARGIVEAHGGAIHASSLGRGQGCTIQFTLPWQLPSADDATAEQPATDSAADERSGEAPRA